MALPLRHRVSDQIEHFRSGQADFCWQSATKEETSVPANERRLQCSGESSAKGTAHPATNEE